MSHLTVFFEGAILSSVVMLITWLVYLRTRNASNVDVAWVLSSYCVAIFWLYTSLISLSTKFVLACLLTIWCLRLGGFLFYTRARIGKRDQRYETISDSWQIKQTLGFLFHYQFQGVLLLSVVLPFFVLILTDDPTLMSFKSLLAIILVIIGLIGEAMADWQLYQFKQSKMSGVCTVGLWGMSRHPNYFFEWLIWLGFAVFVVSMTNWITYLAFISPLSLYLIMTKITGPLTENQILSGSRREEYEKIQKCVPLFFPKIFSREQS